jgi:sec-independent protein translocase protein TatB
MITGELLVIFAVGVVVFGPNKLPMLARHLGLLWRYKSRLHEQLNQFWQKSLLEQQLLENQQKAEKAEQDSRSSL